MSSPLLLGGPFLEGEEGGLAVASSGLGRKELEAFASAGPAGASGLITYRGLTWFAPMRLKDFP